MDLKQKRISGRYATGVMVLLAVLLCLMNRLLLEQSADLPRHAARTVAASNFTVTIAPADCPDPRTRRDMETVARDIITIVSQRFVGPAPETCPILLSRGDHPLTHPPQNGQYRIELSVDFQHRDFARMAYQLGHEMGHVMMGTHGFNCGVDEVMATAASLQALDDLDARWAVQPPYPNWQYFHSNFCEYRALVEKLALATFPVQVQEAARERRWDYLTLYLRFHIPDMEADICSKRSRNLQTLGAILLRTTTLPWSEFAGAGVYIRYHSAEDAKAARGVPVRLRQAHTALWRLGREHSLQLYVVHFSHPPRLQEALLHKGFLFQEDGEWIWLMECQPQKEQSSLNQLTVEKPTLIESRPAN